MEFFGNEQVPVAVATISGDQPRVRFMSFKMVEDGKIYFLTGKKKKVYQELMDHSKLEMCSMPSDKREWVRVSAKAKFVEEYSLKEKAFEILPLLEKAYSSPDNEEIAMFYLDEIHAEKFALGMKPEKL